MLKESLTKPKTSFIDVPTVSKETTHKIAIYEWNSGSSPVGTVFCVHGLTRNGRDFDVLASKLCSDYHVYSVDIAGRGKSQWLEDYSLYNYNSYLADIIYIINHLKLNDIHWIGTSMGGIIGMMLANTSPSIIKTMTLNDIGCLVPKEGLERILKYISEPTIFSNINKATASLRDRTLSFGLSDEEFSVLLTHSLQKTDDEKIMLTYDPNITKSLNIADKPVEDVNLWAMWEVIKSIPTLLIRGMDSDILTHETAIGMKESHPNLTLLEIANTGHAPALMNDNQVGSIKNFLGKNK
ncbi:MAG: alpha/beta hydrolase [Rickettsiales bacterium]